MGSKPKRCWGNEGKVHHCAGCRPARPLCRWMRAMVRKYAACHCGAYHFPHRYGSGLCGKAGHKRLNEVVWGRGEGSGGEAGAQGLEDAALA